VGVLYSIREFITYIFEVPSGIIADHYGKKNELMMCFIFYIISFVLFFIGGSYGFFIIAMLFFGLGEAFRSGTHKSMILSYLEQNNWFEHKAFVYGRTRSFSLFGSSISSFLSVLIIINLPATRWIFLITTIPYVLDFILIWSYPESLNERTESKLTVKNFIRLSIESIKSIIKQKFMLKIVFSSATFDGIFKTIKDYIQPIIILLIVVESDEKIKIVLGIIYGVFYIFSSLASRNVYRLRNHKDSSWLMNKTYSILSLSMMLISVFVHFNYIIPTVIVFFIIYIIKDMRRPLFVDIVGDYMAKKQRATVLSVESQFRSILIIFIAPLFGYLSDQFGIAIAFLVFSVVSIIFSWLFKLKRPVLS
jgi:MFS family permease